MHPPFSRRRMLAALLSTASAGALTACGGGGGSDEFQAPGPAAPVVASIVVNVAPEQLSVGRISTASASLRDASGATVSGPSVTWSSSNPAVVTVTADGHVVGLAAGQAEIIATVGAVRGSRLLTVLPTLSISEGDVVSAMLARTPAHIEESINGMLAMIPRNSPAVGEVIRAKIALLQRPGLAQEIVQNNYTASVTVRLTDGHSVPIAAVFPAGGMRGQAERTLGVLAATLPLLEAFFDVSYPARQLEVWYGFAVGAQGGASLVRLEDQETYEASTPASRLPYDAITVHEVAHGYIGHESLNQFVEVLVYNQILTGSTSLDQWSAVRGYVPDRPDNVRVHALLDIYRILGFEAMRTAYRRIYPLRVLYGQDAGPTVAAIFVDVAPASAKERVAALARRIEV